MHECQSNELLAGGKLQYTQFDWIDMTVAFEGVRVRPGRRRVDDRSDLEFLIESGQ